MSTDQTGIHCPHCQTEFTVETGTENPVCPDCGRSVNEGHPLLPPKFLADDPEFDHFHRTNSRNVLLPDGHGGLHSVRNDIVRVEHRGKTYELVALDPLERKRYQRITNIVSIALGILFLLIFFFLVW